MGTRQVGLADVRHAGAASRLRLLAPIRYLFIIHPEKIKYDFLIPLMTATVGWLCFEFLFPKIQIFSDTGLLKYTRDILTMAVPFLIGALASVSMGAPGGDKLDRRPGGAEISLGDSILTLRQFVCHLLGYLSFLGFFILIATILAALTHDTIVGWIGDASNTKAIIRSSGVFVLICMLSSFGVTVLWALYFLTDIMNRSNN